MRAYSQAGFDLAQLGINFQFLSVCSGLYSSGLSIGRKKLEKTVGVTRDASVTIFNLTDKNKYLEYVTKEIYPLILII